MDKHSQRHLEVKNSTSNQNLNYKILRGGTLSQPWPSAIGMRMKCSGHFASSADAVPEFDWRPKKKIFAAICYYIRPEFGIYSCWEQLFPLIIQTFTFNGKIAEISLGGTLKSRCGDAKSRWGDASPLQFKYSP